MPGEAERIQELIRRGEGINTEFKRTIGSAQRIARILVSFANTSGGLLLIGVEDDGQLTGIESEVEELEKLEIANTRFIEEELPLVYKMIDVGIRRIMVIEVSESEGKPHFVINEKGEKRIYIRVKDKTTPTNRLLEARNTEIGLTDINLSRQIKSLFLYLKSNDSVSAKDFSKIINFSERRTSGLLNELARRNILLKRLAGEQELYSLRLEPEI
jgi:predicted HTH transcriptional regulator